MTLLVQGALTRDDDLIQSFFDLAPVEVRTDALGHLGFQFLHAAAVDDEVLARAQAVWEWRAAEAEAGRTELAELNGFYWWVRSGRFDPAWWLPLLNQAAGSPTFDPHSMVGEALASVAQLHPALALTTLQQLLTRHSEPWRRHSLVRHAPQVIAAALDADDTGLVQQAQELMNTLGREGHVDLDHRVQAVRAKRP